MVSFNSIDWERVVKGLGFEILERKSKELLLRIPGTEAEGGGKLLVTDNGGEINLGRIVYQPVYAGAAGSVAYTNHGGRVGAYTMAYRIRCALEGSPIDYQADYDAPGPDATCAACERTLRTAAELIATLERLEGFAKAAELRTKVGDFQLGPHPGAGATATQTFVHAKLAAVFVDVALNAIRAIAGSEP